MFTVLVREVDSLNTVLAKALRRRFRRAEVKYCLLEDEHSRSTLLAWAWESPLTSRAAKFSYLLGLAVMILAGILVYGQLQQPVSDARNFNEAYSHLPPKMETNNG